MNIVLNELSVLQCNNATISVYEARMIIDKFVEILHELMTHKCIKSIIATGDIYNLYITSDYGIQEWLKDKEVPKNRRDFVRSVYANRCEYINKDNYNLSEFKVHVGERELIGIGCLVAYELCGKVISLLTHQAWNESTIRGIYTVLDLETNNIICTETQLENISEFNQIESVQNESVESIFQSISSGQDLWDQRDFLFPNLEFCDSVKYQLIEDSERFHIQQILIRLQRMNQYFGDDDTVYNPQKLGFNARTESETVQQNLELKKERLFKLPDGTFKYFFDHIGFTGKYCGRIHFWPDKANNRCYIGYIGKHLKTKKFTT